MSAAVFSRWFKGRVGCTFQRYLNELRVARVCARLVNGPESITEAAFGCGYNSLANFNRRFRELTSLTPKEFRSQTRQIQERSLHASLIRLGRHGVVRVVPDGRGRSPALPTAAGLGGESTAGDGAAATDGRNRASPHF